MTTYDPNTKKLELGEPLGVSQRPDWSPEQDQDTEEDQ
jgi:hypothetical protein